MIVAELKRTGAVHEFTPEQWEALDVNGDRDITWTVIDSEGIIPIEAEQIESETFLDIAFKAGRDLIDYGMLMDEKGIKYDHRIKDQDKLKELYQAAVDK